MCPEFKLVCGLNKILIWVWIQLREWNSWKPGKLANADLYKKLRRKCTLLSTYNHFLTSNIYIQLGINCITCHQWCMFYYLYKWDTEFYASICDISPPLCLDWVYWSWSFTQLFVIELHPKILSIVTHSCGISNTYSMLLFFYLTQNEILEEFPCFESYTDYWLLSFKKVQKKHPLYCRSSKPNNL